MDSITQFKDLCWERIRGNSQEICDHIWRLAKTVDPPFNEQCRGVSLGLGATYDEGLCGSLNMHIPICWAGEEVADKQWLLRVRLHAELTGAVTRAHSVALEVSAMRFLHHAGLPVPCAWLGPPIDRKDGGYVLHWCVVEHVKGTPARLQDASGLAQNSVTMQDLAQVYIQLSENPLRGIGSVWTTQFSEMQALDNGLCDDFIIGPTELDFNNADDIINASSATPLPRLYGPYLSYAQCQTAYLDRLIDLFMRESSPDRSQLYMCHEVRRLVNLETDASGDTVVPSYMFHADARGDHIMVDEDGHITGIIDWEFCRSMPDYIAFASPIGATPFVQMVKNGSLELGALETILHAELVKRNRPDLARHIMTGRRYHMIRVVTQNCCEENLPLINAVRRLWDPDAQDFASFQAWIDYAHEVHGHHILQNQGEEAQKSDGRDPGR